MMTIMANNRSNSNRQFRYAPLPADYAKRTLFRISVILSVGNAYGKKFRGVFETMGVGNLVADPRVMGKKEIFKIINRAFEDKKN